MKFIKVIDCQNKEHNLNVDFVYNVNTFTGRDKITITNIHLNHKDDNYTFSVIKTDEPINSILKRLEQYK